jgi:hypothetical protein
MLFGIAGGLGIGCFSFFYEREGFACFFLAGRHSWQDDLQYLSRACERFGFQPVIRETSGAKAAEAQLRQTLARGPCIAWVDMAHLPHRAMPSMWSGGGYHVITVYEVNDESGTAVIGDLTDEPILIPLQDLSKARGRIKKQKNRLLSLDAGSGQAPLESLIREGLRICHHGLTQHRMKNFTLDSIRQWCDRLYGSKDKESWDRVFAPGNRAWRGLSSIYEFVEHYGTGGGLCRPLFAEFLSEAAEVLDRKDLESLSVKYAALGRMWTELGQAALPDDVAALREVKEVTARKAELRAAGGPIDQMHVLSSKLLDLEKEAADRFPLSVDAYASLRASLQARVRAIYDEEIAAHRALGKTVS